MSDCFFCRRLGECLAMGQQVKTKAPLDSINASLLLIISAFLWQFFRNLLSKSPLTSIPGPQSHSWVKGNLDQLFDRFGWDFQDELAEKYGSVVKVENKFGQKALYVFDPRALHHILIKDYQAVYDRPLWSLSSNALTFGPGLLATHGELHRKQRKMLNPVFSIKHMRHMTPIFYHVAHKLENGIRAQLQQSGDKDVDMLKWMHRTALELIGQGGLGHSFDPLTDKDHHDEYAAAMKKLMPTLFPLTFWRMFLPLLDYLGPASFRQWLAGKAPSKGIRELKHIVDTMDESTKNILRKKRQALSAGDEAVVEQVAQGKDIMSILLRANMEASDEDRLSEEELLGQMSTLVFAASDTTSSALSRVLHLLGRHPDVQEKLRAEIREARSKASGDVPHDELMALPYLDSVCRETLRVYSPVSFTNRYAYKDTVLPLSKPIRDINGNLLQEIHVPKGTEIFPGIRAINTDKSIWGDDAKIWKPERWLSPLPSTVTEAHIPGVYSHLMTFNGGGRSCIGFKFSQLEMKVVLATLLSTFKFSLSDRDNDIHWNLAGVSYPSVGEDPNPRFPMKVCLIESA
ncbi:cytochrome P450 [Panus rudis PR-1116 ss-1]|nr:cytochrome P450 [Panus rudis PR-1116 ss-1]